MILRVLVEGTSDVPVVREALVRGLGRVQGTDFQVFWHKGKGRLPANPLGPPAARDETLLGQLAALIVSLGVGLASGLMPARRAAALDPVVALTAE